MSLAYIGLGANLGDPAAQLKAALQRLEELGSVQACSPLYRSAPMGPRDQPDFCNAVCALRTVLAPSDLMRILLQFEREAGRIRDRKWGPRTLDLDLLDVDQTLWHSESLQLPHPGIALRNFVLVPWSDIAPQLVVPGVGRIADAAAAIGRDGLSLWSE